VALNIAMMHLRKRGIEAQSLDIIEVEQNSATSVLPTASYVCDPLKYLSLKRAIATLPKGRRTVVILHDIQGLTHREVGLRLGIQAETSKAQLHHAHRTLRSILTSTHPSEANLREDSVLSSIPAHVFEPGGLGEVEFTAAAD
jgi:RNA polymerase sigma-70 factor (ECF subfamily)